MRGCFSSRKAEDEGGLFPGEDDNAAGRKTDRKDTLDLGWFDYMALADIRSGAIHPNQSRLCVFSPCFAAVPPKGSVYPRPPHYKAKSIFANPDSI